MSNEFKPHYWFPKLQEGYRNPHVRTLQYLTHNHPVKHTYIQVTYITNPHNIQIYIFCKTPQIFKTTYLTEPHMYTGIHTLQNLKLCKFTYPKISILKYLSCFVCVWVITYMCVCATCTFLVPMETRRGVQFWS